MTDRGSQKAQRSYWVAYLFVHIILGFHYFLGPWAMYEPTYLCTYLSGVVIGAIAILGVVVILLVIVKNNLLIL